MPRGGSPFLPLRWASHLLERAGLAGGRGVFRHRPWVSGFATLILSFSVKQARDPCQRVTMRLLRDTGIPSPLPGT